MTTPTTQQKLETYLLIYYQYQGGWKFKTYSNKKEALKAFKNHNDFSLYRSILTKVLKDSRTEKRVSGKET